MDNTINIFGIKIYYYAIIMAIAILVGTDLARRWWKKNNLDENVFDNMVFYLIIFAFIGARTWYVLFSSNLDYYFSNPINIINLREGGLAIHGAMVGGLCTILYFSKKYKIPFLKITDIATPCLMLGQVIGRWGNFMNQEAHGPQTSYEFLTNTLHLPNFIVEGMNIGGIYYHPTFLYESVWNLLGFIIIYTLIRKISMPTGMVTAFYLIWYGFIRSLIEILRTDALYLGGIKIAQLTSFSMLIAGIVLIVIIKRRKNENSN